MNELTTGTRVRLVNDVERYPHFIARAGLTGVVVDVGDETIFAVKLDAPLPGAEEWSNEVHWMIDPVFGHEHEDDLEVIA